MSDLIPSTADVRDAYSSESSDSTYANRMFDLWLAKYKAKVVAKTEERIIKLLEDSRERTNQRIQNGGLTGVDLAERIGVYKTLGNAIALIKGEK